MIKWDRRFLDLAAFVAAWSRDPSKRVGAVIVDDKKRIVSLGFNGFPRGVADDDRLHVRESKYEIIIHAEVNALLFGGNAQYRLPLVCGAPSRVGRLRAYGNAICAEAATNFIEAYLETELY